MEVEIFGGFLVGLVRAKILVEFSSRLHIG